MTKRFFTVDDGGCDYWLVARDLEHAKQLLRESGVEFTSEAGDSYPIDAKEVAEIEWIEVAPERAAQIKCHPDDSNRLPAIPLTEFDIGNWFASEW